MNLQVECEYDRLRYRFSDALVLAANAHDVGDMPAIENGFNELDHALPRNDESRYYKLHIALNFWDGWIDARNHEWQYYEGISQEDWSAFARQIAQELRDDLEISNERVLRRFDLRQRRSSLIEYIRDLFHHGNAT